MTVRAPPAMLELAVSVGELVAFCHRAGDIDHRFRPSPTGEQGVAGHQLVYRRRGPSYRSEYPVEYCHREGEVCLRSFGRRMRALFPEAREGAPPPKGWSINRKAPRPQ